MRLSRNPTEQEWAEIVALGPGMRMYKDKKTLFYNGEILGGFQIYNESERQTWEVIIVLPGVEVIPEYTFRWCLKVEVVIMSNTVIRIENFAFGGCKSLVFVKLSTRLEFIGFKAFKWCRSLTSIFIPPSCREIGHWAFDGCSELIIVSVPQHTTLGVNVIHNTAIIQASPFENGGGFRQSNEVKAWIKNINRDSEVYSLHRLCCSDYPDIEQVYAFVKDNGLEVMKNLNNIGVSPYQYLAANPYVDFEAQTLINRYILEKMNLINTGN